MVIHERLKILTGRKQWTKSVKTEGIERSKIPGNTLVNHPRFFQNPGVLRHSTVKNLLKTKQNPQPNNQSNHQSNPIVKTKPNTLSSREILKMALQWLILTYVVAAEASIALIITLPLPKLISSRIVSLVSLLLQPATGIVPFSAFQLMDLYWKNEHRLMCTSEVCTSEERDRYEKTIYKAQRNAVLCVSACLLYWCIYRSCKYHKDIKELEEVEKRYKNM